MPLMTGNFSDVAERVSKDYWFDHIQSSLKVTNSGLFSIIVDVSDETKVIRPGESVTFDEEFKKFSVRCKTKGSDTSAFSVELDSYRAAIANLDGGGGGVTEAQVKIIMAPLVNAVTAGLTITAPIGSLEVGAALTTSVGFSWTIGNHGSAKSAKIRDTSANVDIETLAVAASGTHTETVSITNTIATTQSYRLDVTDNLDRVVSSPTRSIVWLYASYYGNGGSTIDAAGVKALTTKNLKTTLIGNFTIADQTNYKWIVVPQALEQPGSFKDSATGFAVTMNAPIEITITNDQGVSVLMYAYRSVNSFGGAITIQGVA